MMMENKVINLAILGCGTVGGNVYKLIDRQQEMFEQKIGCQIRVKKILVKNLTEEKEGIDHSLMTDDIQEILSDESIDIVVEMMGGVHPAKEYILRSLKAKKHVVTANKDVLSMYAEELFEAAAENQLDLKMESVVAGGIPVIAPLLKSLAGNEIEEVIGIVNGTSNFILTKMAEDGLDYSEAVMEALGEGKAETDPTEDIDGLDTAKKCAIMASVAFRSWVTTDDVMTVGINRITAADVLYAREMGYVIKLLTVAKESEGEIVASVYPALIPKSHPLASVNDHGNAVYIRGDVVGELMLYGNDAGARSVAGAVVGDVMEIAENIGKGACGRIRKLCYRNLKFKQQSEISNQFFLRLKVEDKPGVLAAVANVFGVNHVSIKQLLQKSLGSNEAELMIVTEKVCEQNFRDALSVLAQMDKIRGVSNVIRVHGLK